MDNDQLTLDNLYWVPSVTLFQMLANVTYLNSYIISDFFKTLLTCFDTY